jgi:hypothetical protein
MNFSSHPLHVCHIADLAFLQYFDGYFFPCEGVDAHLNFSEGPFSEVASEDIVADGPASL